MGGGGGTVPGLVRGRSLGLDRTHVVWTSDWELWEGEGVQGGVGEWSR